MLLALLGTSCTYVATIRDPGTSGATMTVSSPVVYVDFVERDVFGQFDLTITGRDELVGLRWLPGVGSRLRVEERDIDEGWASGSEPGVITLRYQLIGDPPEGVDTGSPPDVGLLRLFFAEHPTVDIWVEVQ
jgi:hypothetical protein